MNLRNKAPLTSWEWNIAWATTTRKIWSHESFSLLPFSLSMLLRWDAFLLIMVVKSSYRSYWSFLSAHVFSFCVTLGTVEDVRSEIHNPSSESSPMPQSCLLCLNSSSLREALPPSAVCPAPHERRHLFGKVRSCFRNSLRFSSPPEWRMWKLTEYKTIRRGCSYSSEKQERTWGCAIMAMTVRAKSATNSMLMKILYCREKEKTHKLYNHML